MSDRNTHPGVRRSRVGETDDQGPRGPNLKEAARSWKEQRSSALVNLELIRSAIAVLQETLDEDSLVTRQLCHASINLANACKYLVRGGYVGSRRDGQSFVAEPLTGC
jgi:hypothetical protein